MPLKEASLVNGGMICHEEDQAPSQDQNRDQNQDQNRDQDVVRTRRRRIKVDGAAALVTGGAHLSYKVFKQEAQEIEEYTCFDSSKRNVAAT